MVAADHAPQESQESCLVGVSLGLSSGGLAGSVLLRMGLTGLLGFHLNQ